MNECTIKLLMNVCEEGNLRTYSYMKKSYTESS